VYRFLQKAKDAGELFELATPDTGEISCVFVCCDLPQQYLDGYLRIASNIFEMLKSSIT